MNKLIRDGKVAVLYSGGFGAGWYTWNSDYPDCIFNPEIVTAVESKDTDKADLLAKTLYGEDFYTGGACGLGIAWLPIGTPFTIEEYDGRESIRTVANLNLVA